MSTAPALSGTLPALGYGGYRGPAPAAGTGLAGGLVGSQFPTLYITAAIHLYLDRVREWLAGRCTPARQPGTPWRGGRGKLAKLATFPPRLINNKGGCETVPANLTRNGLGQSLCGFQTGP